VEVASPSTARYDRGLKRRFYQRAGVPEYWIVDLDARIVERWRPGDARPEVLDGVLSWQPGPEAPALTIDLAAFFARVMDAP
jgi:Uma2 family endonuclease